MRPFLVLIPFLLEGIVGSPGTYCSDQTGGIEPTAPGQYYCLNTCDLCVINCHQCTNTNVIIVSGAAQTIINCVGNAVCDNFKIYIGDVTNMGINDELGQYTNANFTRISYNTSINCIGDRACVNVELKIHGNFSDIVVLDADDGVISNAMDNVIIDVTLDNDQIFEIYCGESDRFNCELAQLLCNKGKCYCFGSGCVPFTIISNSPTNAFIGRPSGIPSVTPTTNIPSHSPMNTPSYSPTNTPSYSPLVPSYSPSVPSYLPSVPSYLPTERLNKATEFPSVIPTKTPSNVPSVAPSDTPSDTPTSTPTTTLSMNSTNMEIGVDLNSLRQMESKRIQDKSLNYYGIVTVCIIGVFGALGLFGNIHACYVGNDLFKIIYIIIGGFYVYDLSTDIFFCYEIFSMKQIFKNDAQLLIILSITLVTLIIPIFLTIGQLIKYINQWKLNALYSSWLLSYGALLYGLSIITRSSFVAVNLCNSNTFCRDVFGMGLHADDLIMYNNQRIYSTVFLENVPQIIVQLWYQIWLGKVSPTPLLAMCLSILSIIVQILQCILSNSILTDSEYIILSFTVKSAEIAQKRDRLLYRVKKMKKELCAILEINPLTTYTYKPILVSFDGLKFTIKIRNINIDKTRQLRDELSTKLFSTQKSGYLSESIKRGWKLNSIPMISSIDTNIQYSQNNTNIPGTHLTTSSTSENIELHITNTLN